MPTERLTNDSAPGSFDNGLLSPVSIGFEAGLDDLAVAQYLVAAEVALVRAWAAVGAAPRAVAETVSEALGWQGEGQPCAADDAFVAALIQGSASGGNPVIPLVQAIDAVGVIAADIATLSRTEIGEVTEGAGGGSSAMPQKQNPTASVLIRSAAMRAPHLGATLHTAASLAVEERPDGAWHAEWPTLRELLRLAAGAAGSTERMVAGLRVDHEATRRNLEATGGLLLAERLSVVLAPVIGSEALQRVVAAAGAGEGELRDLIAAEPGLVDFTPEQLEELLDPTAYTGLAGHLVDELLLDDSDAGDSAHPAPFDSKE